LVAGLITIVACAGGSQSQPAGQAPAGAAPLERAPEDTLDPSASVAPARQASDWLGSDSAARTATITLEVTSGGSAAPSALLNGYRSGEARVIVPLRWTIKWNWRNSDSTSPHSLAIMTQREKIPLEGGRPAFTNAMTRMLTGGLAVGQTDQTTFEADEAGWFWILCGVPEHAVEGEWLELRVDPEATSGKVEIRKKQ
jgi:hypothetical protein